jgi:hypothetical protein
MDEVLGLPAAVGLVFRDVRPEVERRLSEGLFRDWLTDGLAVARSSFRAWEATTEYFRATPHVLERLEEPRDLRAWSAGGKELSAASAAIAGAYFRASPQFLHMETIGQVPSWVQAGRRLYHGTWKSGALSARFFELTPAMLQYVGLSDLSDFCSFLDSIAQRSSELADECLALAPECFSYVDEETVAGYLKLLHTTAEHNWKYAKETQRAAAVALPRVARAERERFLSFAGGMAQDKGKRYLSLLAEGSRALSDLEMRLHHSALDMFEVLAGLSQEAAVEFLHSAPQVLQRIDSAGLQRWYTEGAGILEQNEAAGVAYFKLESARGEAIIQELSVTVSLEEVAPILQMYARALTGTEMLLKPTPDLARRNFGWAVEDRASTDGTNVFLPREVALFPVKTDNWGWFKVLCTHQTGHLEFRSFDFSFARDGNVFPTRRLEAETDRRTHGAKAVAVLSDFERFFDLFPERRLASDIFAAIEDARVDHLVRTRYAGLRRSYGLVQTAAVLGRPAPQQLPLRQGLVELLVRMTLLDSPSTIPVPAQLRDVVHRMAAVVSRVRSMDALVEDSAEATILLYRLLIRVPNTPPPEEFDWNDEDVGQLGEGMPDPTSGVGEADSAGMGGEEFTPGSGTEQDVPYESPKEVDYRGDFKPELVQTLANLRKGNQKTDDTVQSPPLTEEMIRQLLEKSAEIDLSSVVEGNIDDPSGLFISSLMSEAIEGPDAEFKDEAGQATAGKQRSESDESLQEEVQTSLYDEWDFLALDYKPAWCRVRESVIQEGSEDFYRQTVDRHAGLINEVRRQFEMMVPETYRKEKRLRDGEEFDLDAAIEAIIERRAGVTPNDKIYWRRNKTERDVAVIFLLDMSASTAEAIDEKPQDDHDDDDIPDDPRQYLFWLRSKREQAKKSYRRIIDLEKESTVLLIRALETIGDTYGIYGFSGYGRENVEFYGIKGLEEPFSDRVMRRIDGITPLHATRMGPAIRHAAAKLDDIGAKTKVLFLISDGRPQDRGYSREGAEKEYAVQDTHMALLEAKSKGIIPFLLTVDRAGHDYMKEMCGDMPYEVLADITLLPKRLPQLYSRLTL